LRRIAIIFGIAFALAACRPAAGASSSADAPHVHVQLVFPQTQLTPGTQADAGLYFKLEPGWHVYWQNAGDSGEPPHIKWDLPKGITASDLQFPAPKRLPLGPLMDFGYENEVLFPFSIDIAKTAKPGPAVLHAKVDWLVCREVCIPGKAELSQQVQIGSGAAPVSASTADQALWNRLAHALPTPLPAHNQAIFQPTPSGFRLAVDTGRRETTGQFFPADQDILDNPAPQPVTPTPTGLILDLKKDANLSANPAQLKGVLELADGRNYQLAAIPGTIAAPPAAPSANAGALAKIVAFAFLGGLLLNLMPCVFPVLFLKGLSLVNSGSEERHRLRLHGLVYTLGILVSFWILVAALLALRAAGDTLGWGFQFQSPVFLFLLSGLFFFLGLALAGQFEIGLSVTGAGQSLAARQGYAGSFFTGVLAVVVATPCTAPFMGAAIGYALAQSAVVTFAVFTALALGLAAPYVALTLQPAWTRVLPKPGAWMEVLKQAVSLFMFGTVVWLTWVLAQAYGAALVAAVLSSFVLLAVAGWFLGRWPGKTWAKSIAAAFLLIVVAAGFLAPIELAQNQEKLSTEGSEVRSTAWQPWSTDAVQKNLAAGRPVFVDFTASWCLSCQVNERVALDKPDVMQAFGEHNVVLLKADWTREDPAITQALTTLGRSAVPVYALYAPGEDAPTLLPQVLTPGIVTDALAKLPNPESQGAREQGNWKPGTEGTRAQGN
jgi:thiol:disulfide interchange protein